MKIEIFDEKKEEEVVLRLRLFKVGSSIQLWVVNKNGERVLRGALLRVDNDGLYRPRRVIPELGLPIDDMGRIKLNE